MLNVSFALANLTHVHLLPAGCTSRLPESRDLSWSLLAVHGAEQMPGWRLLHVLDEHPSLPFPHTDREKSCDRSSLTRYGALIIVSLEMQSVFVAELTGGGGGGEATPGGFPQGFR